MSSDQRSNIRSAIINARNTLEEELRRQLEKYGIQEDNRLLLEELPHLSAQERHTRRTVDAAIERELESTEGNLERSITNYVREATKIHLNRFVALKAIEVRDLVEETITERTEYGNRSYMQHTVAEVAGELTDTSDDGYSTALYLAYQEIGAEIRMIFEDSEYTAIDFDVQVREDILNQLDEIDDETWKSDEALGWVYQYFGEEEREEIDERVDEENYKITGTDIATKTQLFTPRYIVEWMVDNSLGRTWLEMRGERTNINDDENCFYLSPLNGTLADRKEKPVEDIKIFDPACGSGHMLFYSFEVLYQMYLEEGKVPQKQIPKEILKNNLYGIDIDPGAAQLAALSLYIKAKNIEPDVKIEQIGITSADAVLLSDNNKENIITQSDSELEQRVLERVWENFGKIREWGSLVRIEEEIEDIIDEEIENMQSSGQTHFTDNGLAKQASMVSFSGEKESWEQIKNRLLSQVNKLAEEALEQNNPIEEMFVGEVEKSVELIDIYLQKYDVVISNPPYLGSRKMGEGIKEFVKNNYTGSRDLYSAFIERCNEFAYDSGYISMITMETFMYQHGFRKLRKQILDDINFIDLAHLETRNEGYMNVCFVGKKIENNKMVESRFIRLLNKDKREGLDKITRKIREKSDNKNVFSLNQSSFKNINKQPFVYWFGKEILKIFEENDRLEDYAEVKTGLITSDDDRFLRKWWEISKDMIDKEYVRFQKSGTDSIYYDLAQDYVNWENDGKEIKDYEKSAVKNEDYYFCEGVTFRGFGKMFVARRHHSNMIHSDHAHLVYSENLPDNYILGLLNSSLSRFIIHGLSPGLNFTAGDGKQFPIKENIKFKEEVEDIANRAVQIKKKKHSLKETNSDFDPSFLMSSAQNSITDILYIEDLLESSILVIHGLIDQYVFSEYDISSDTKSIIYDDLPKNLSNYSHIENSGKINNAPDRVLNNIEQKTLSEKDFNDIKSEVENNIESDLSDLSESTGVSPYTVTNIKNNIGYTSDEKEEAAARLLSYFIGCSVGRWELDTKQQDNKEILVFDPDEDNNIIDHIKRCINITYEDTDTYKIVDRLEKLLNSDIKTWLRNKFFRHHHCEEYRRRGQRVPIYWQLESPSGSFSCFLYYHAIDRNTLPKIRGQYLDPRIDELKNELETLNTQIDDSDPNKELLNRKEKVQNNVDDLKQFRDTIDKMIDDGVAVDVEKGIWENIKVWDQYEVLETGLPKLKSSYSR